VGTKVPVTFKNTLDGSKGPKIDMIRSWNISWAESSVVYTAV